MTGNWIAMLIFVLMTGLSVRLIFSPTSWVFPTIFPLGDMELLTWQVAQVGAVE